jgi:hypothetical protein
VSKRRGSRLFSGQPGLLLVSEDIPGITMPAPPPKDAPPLVDDELEFDLVSFHAEEDQAEEDAGNEGPLRVFLGSEEQSAPVVAEEEPPVFDISALAMPEGPDDSFDDDDSSLQFLSDSVEVDDEELVDLGAPPPVLAMGVSNEVRIDDAGAWDDSPTLPKAPPPRTAVIRDTPPMDLPPAALPPTVDYDPLDLPEPDSFLVDESADFGEDGPVDVTPGAPDDIIWDDDDTGFFEEKVTQQREIPTEPPRPKVDTKGESRTFRAIPDKEDPSILPLLLILIGIVIMAVAFSLNYTGSDATEPIEPVLPTPTMAPVTNMPAPRTESLGQVGEVARNVGFLSIDSDKPANIYVDDRKVGITPVVKAQVSPGRHRVLAVEVETGKRKALTADVNQGEERRVRFAFQAVQ